MGDKRISDDTEVTSLELTDYIPIVRGGANYKAKPLAVRGQPGEYTVDGHLVWPESGTQVPTVIDDLLTQIVTTVDGITYTMTFTYDADENCTSITVSNGTTTYTNTITYVDGDITTISDWV